MHPCPAGVSAAELLARLLAAQPIEVAQPTAESASQQPGRVGTSDGGGGGGGGSGGGGMSLLQALEGLRAQQAAPAAGGVDSH